MTQILIAVDGSELARLAVGLDDVEDVELRPLVSNTSAAHALQATAELEEVGLIVVGSSHTGPLGGSSRAAPPSAC